MDKAEVQDKDNHSVALAGADDFNGKKEFAKDRINRGERQVQNEIRRFERKISQALRRCLGRNAMMWYCRAVAEEYIIRVQADMTKQKRADGLRWIEARCSEMDAVKHIRSEIDQLVLDQNGF